MTIGKAKEIVGIISQINHTEKVLLALKDRSLHDFSLVYKGCDKVDITSDMAIQLMAYCSNKLDSLKAELKEIQ